MAGPVIDSFIARRAILDKVPHACLLHKIRASRRCGRRQRVVLGDYYSNWALGKALFSKFRYKKNTVAMLILENLIGSFEQKLTIKIPIDKGSELAKQIIFIAKIGTTKFLYL
ncbi:hypothetical protein BpHYR1_026131 [Brachionus plicatilis]|uniref:Uncharacterized protein n=1 Tax=Brachionus plicatilis TaxID=10195 RepID=A0A3M7T733_BRAPC|nr:hypothetical protein BpHYR1_026131 [Brachionus plicatilis]